MLANLVTDHERPVDLSRNALRVLIIVRLRCGFGEYGFVA